MKSNESSEDSYISLGIEVFFCFVEKVFKLPKNYRCAFRHNNAFKNALGYI